MNRAFLVAALLLPVLALGAQEERGWIDIQGGPLLQKASWTKNLPSRFQNSMVLGLGSGTWFSPHWGGEFSVLAAKVEYLNQGAISQPGGQEIHGMVSLLCNLYPSYRWAPYLRAGLGVTRLGSELSSDSIKGNRDSASETCLNLHGGAGFHIYPGEHLKLGLEFRLSRIQASVPARRTEGMILGSIGYRWGGIKPASEPVPAVLKTPPAPAPEPRPKSEPLPAPIATPLPIVAPPSPEPVLPVLPPQAPPPVPEAPRKFVLNNETVRFAEGKADLDAKSIAAIQTLAEQLKALRGQGTLLVTGYTSSRGGSTLNKQLSKRRADAVALVLVKAGIPATSITTLGRGSENPIASNWTSEGQASNRRVEIEIRD